MIRASGVLYALVPVGAGACPRRPIESVKLRLGLFPSSFPQRTLPLFFLLFLLFVSAKPNWALFRWFACGRARI